MKNIKQIRESYKNITSSEEASDIKNLFEDGLLDERKLSLVERALKKDASDQTISDRKMIKNLAEQLIIHYNVDRTGTVEVLDESVKRDTKEYLAKYDPSLGGNKFPTDKDMPQVLILKRKAIRIYPDNQKVALYYSDTLNKYVTIPFGAVGINERYEAIANAAYKAAQTKLVRGRRVPRVPGKLNQFVSKNIPLGRESDPELNKALEKRFGHKVDFAKIQNQNIDNLRGLSDASKLGLKHGAMAKRFMNNLFKKKRKEKEETSPTPEPIEAPKRDPLTPEQEKVKSDVSRRRKTARNIGQKSKNPDLSSEKKTALRNMARRYLAYGQVDLRRAGIRESFFVKLNERNSSSISAGDVARKFGDIATDIIPGVSNVKSAASAIRNATQGNISAAALDAASAVPGIGNALKAVRTARKVSRLSRRGPSSTRVKPKNEPEVDAANSRTRSEPGTAPKSEPGTAPSTRPDTRKPGNKPDDRNPDTTPEVPKPADKPSTPPAKPSDKPEPKPEPKPADKPEPKPSDKPEPKPADKPEPKPSDKPEPKPADKPTAKPSDKPGVPPVVPKKKPGFFRRVRNSMRRNARRNAQDGSAGGSSPGVASNFSKPVEIPDFNLQVSKSRPDAFDTDYARKRAADNKQLDQMINFPTSVQRQQTNESVIEQLYDVDGKTRINIGEDKVVINKIIADKITSLYESLNDENKEKMSLKLNESTESFKKILEFAVRQK